MADLRLVLADVPALLDDLDVAIAGTTSFVEHGARSGDDDADQADGVGGHPAAIAQRRIVAALQPAADWFQAGGPAELSAQLAGCLDVLASEPVLPKLARDLSSAVARAHLVIDRPRDFAPYGPCPNCGRPIWQDRADPDAGAMVRCSTGGCSYRAKLADHHRNQLAAARDSWLTVGELLPAFQRGGRPVTRDQLNGLIYRRGLPREPRSRARWDPASQSLVKVSEVWTYKVGDVIDMIDESSSSEPL